MRTRRSECSWDVDYAGWVVTLHSLEEQDIYSETREEALAWCLVWLMAKGTGHPQGLDWDVSWESGRLSADGVSIGGPDLSQLD